MTIRICLLFLIIPSWIYSQEIELNCSNYQVDYTQDWAFLADQIGGDSIVCLGEESHWIETYLEVKNGLIKYLHQEQSFNVLIFESGFINSFVAHVEELDSLDRMKETLYDLWQTRSTLDLINYTSNSQTNHLPITQLGCDLKGPKSFLFSRLVKNILYNINPTYAQLVSKTDSLFIETRFQWEPEIGKAYRGVYLSEIEEKKFREVYNAVIDTVDMYEQKIIQNTGWTEKEIEFLKRCFLNRIYLIDLMQLPVYEKKHKYRDSIMAKNIEWIIESYLPNEKYMIWAADLHISKNAKWELAGKAWEDIESVIEVLTKLISKRIHSIAIKPLKSLPKERRKVLRKMNFAFIDLKNTNHPSYRDLKTEHDAIIVCKKTKSIKKYKIE